VARDAKEFVLVHGAAHGAWCWEELTPRLVSRGHRVVTLDLPGHGRRAAEASRASVAAYAHAVADLRVFHAMRVPRAYIRCGQDAAVPPAVAAAYAARLGVTPIDMDCAHNAMLSAPDELARILDRI
jgi:pimeloyl-ACP methyl ester carboxylesterase